MEPGLYIVSVLGVAVFLGLLSIGLILWADRALRRRSLAGEHALLRVEVQAKNGLFTAHYDVDRGRSNEVPAATTLAEICASLDEANRRRYHDSIPAAGLIVTYDIYPWRDAEIPKQLVPRIGTSFLVFDVTADGAGFTASDKSTGLAVTAATLDELPGAIEAAALFRWPWLAPDIPAVLHWRRSLTAAGFRPVRD